MDGVGDGGWGGTHQTFNGEALKCYKVSGHRSTGQPHCSALRDTVGYIRNDHAKSRQEVISFEKKDSKLHVVRQTCPTTTSLRSGTGRDRDHVRWE